MRLVLKRVETEPIVVLKRTERLWQRAGAEERSQSIDHSGDSRMRGRTRSSQRREDAVFARGEEHVVRPEMADV